MFQIKGELNVENILSVLHPIQIFKRYSKYFEIPNKKFRAEFRKDPNPSALISYYNGTYLYKDFGEDGAMNCFQFVSRKLNLGFKDVLSRINQDFNLGLAGGENYSGSHYQKPKSIQYPKIEYANSTILNIKSREFQEHDLKWWYNQSWLNSMLNAAKIKPITYFRLTNERKGIVQKLYKCDDYSYSMDYYWHKDIFRRKLYFPKKESHLKWLSNVDNTIVQGWDLLPKSGDTLFITSSFKDSGPFWRIYKQPTAIAPNTESSFIPDKVFSKLKNRYKRIIIFFDNDKTGIEKAKKFSSIYGIPYIHNPIGSPKDPAAFWEKEDGRTFNYYLQKSLSNI